MQNMTLPEVHMQTWHVVPTTPLRMNRRCTVVLTIMGCLQAKTCNGFRMDQTLMRSCLRVCHGCQTWVCCRRVTCQHLAQRRLPAAELMLEARMLACKGLCSRGAFRPVLVNRVAWNFYKHSSQIPAYQCSPSPCQVLPWPALEGMAVRASPVLASDRLVA